MKKIARFAVENPVTIMMIVLGILLLGFISYGKLGTDLFPDLNNPKIYVELKAGERPPEEMEKQFVDQVESIAMRQKDAINVSQLPLHPSRHIAQIPDDGTTFFERLKVPVASLAFGCLKFIENTFIHIIMDIYKYIYC